MQFWILPAALWYIDGNAYKSVKRIKFPVSIIGDRAYVTADVVTCLIPFLFNKKSIKRAQMKLNLEVYIAVLHEKEVKLRSTPPGHYCLPLRDKKEMWKTTEVLLVTLGVERKKKKQKIEILHKQFGHATCKGLIQLLKDAGIKDEVYFEYAKDI